jgi:hypothetical protein
MYQKYCSYNDWILLWVSFEPTLLSEVAGDRSPDSAGWISANASTSPDRKGKDNFPRRLQLLWMLPKSKWDRRGCWQLTARIPPLEPSGKRPATVQLLSLRTHCCSTSVPLHGISPNLSSSLTRSESRLHQGLICDSLCESHFSL